MEFRERLREFIEEQRRKEAESKAGQEELSRRKAEENKKRITEIEGLKQIVKERFVPYFEAINEVFLENEGKLSLWPKYPNPDDAACLTLSWDEDTYRKYSEEGGTGNRIHLTLNLKHKVTVSGGRKPESIGPSTFEFEDGDWQQQLEERILFILSVEDRYHWEYRPKDPSYDYHDRNI